MDDFLSSFNNLFGLSVILLIPFIVQGIKGAWKMAFGSDMASWGQVLTVFLVAWGLLVADALVKFRPDSVEYVRYALGAILAPLFCMGIYDAAKSVVDKFTARKAPDVQVSKADVVKADTAVVGEGS